MFRRHALLAVVVLAIGCEKQRPIPPVERIDVSTPEGQFKWAMEKLERAVIDFKPSGEDGLQFGKRNVTHEVFPPNDERQNYTAQVVIESEAVYVHEQPLESLQQQREERRRKRAREDFERQVKTDDASAEAADPLEEKFISQMEDLATKSHPPRGAEPVIENPEMSDRKVYDLAYLDGRWQLQTKTETDHERLWFEYALKP